MLFIINRIKIILLLLLLSRQISAQEDSLDLTKLSLEDLMKIEVTSVSRKAESLSAAAAAVFVISNEDIKRSGAMTLAEVLQLAPGLHAAKIDANKWAISSRGFNGRFANKLLILIDGRSVYSPVFSGVFWDEQDKILSDIQRIEIIRGPGASVWGSNAVNGIINIITKKAENSQGVSVQTLYGQNDEKFFSNIRYGNKFKENIYYRFGIKYGLKENSITMDNTDARDQYEHSLGEFRIDWDISPITTAVVHGGYYSGYAGQRYEVIDTSFADFTNSITNKTKLNGYHILANWKRRSSASNEYIFQVYYDLSERADEVISQSVKTLDADFQHRFQFGSLHDIVWGAGYRFIQDNSAGSLYISFIPPSRKYGIVSAFLQDEISLLQNKLKLTLGSKLERNSFSGIEIQPSVHLVWLTDDRQSVWVSVSRAVRMPSRIEVDMDTYPAIFPPNSVFPGSPSLIINTKGNEDYKSEILTAYELGYRSQLFEWLSFDFSSFYNLYDKLRTFEPLEAVFGTAHSVPYILLPMIVDNKLRAKSYGFELFSDLRLSDWWKFHFSYSYLKMELDLDKESQDPIVKEIAGQNPKNLIKIRTSFDLISSISFDLRMKFVDELKSFNIGSYFNYDGRLSWRLKKNLEFSLVVKNIFDSRHREFESELLSTNSAVNRRSFYGGISWEF